ncbi:uncharacterized protein LOC124442027 isoform X2 [Xenia sp. Carnegie-2017]|nr:uncharacterized protein LOC124442027 isoform X2 [Xenia sp. Carnegie-2017]
MIPRIKLHKKFTCIWNDVTQKGSSASTTYSCVTSNNIRTINKDVNPDITSNSADHQENHDEGLSESASTVHSHIYSSHIRTINLDVNEDIVLSTLADHQNDENIQPERHLKDNVPRSPLTSNVNNSNWLSKFCLPTRLKAELGHILEKSDVVQDMKERWNLHRYKMLSVIKKTKQKNVSSILEELEDCPVEDEKEVKNRCIMACLPYVLDDQCTHRDMNKKLFWDIVDGKSLGEVQEIINKSSSPGLLSTGTLRNIHSIMLVAEGMIVAKLKTENIVNAVIILLSSFNTFNAEYPKGVNGHCKNVVILLEHLLLNSKGNCKAQLPTFVDHFMSSMK